MIEAFISKIDELNSITDEWWVEYSYPLCIYTEEQLSILSGKLASPCQIYFENGITFDTDMNLIPCNMHFENRIGQLGVDFTTYGEFEDFTQNGIYRSTINRLRQFPSDRCITCKYWHSCYGGCSVTWKNYSFEALMKCKDEYYKT